MRRLAAVLAVVLAEAAEAGVGTMSSTPLWDLADYGGRRLVASTNTLVVPHKYIENQLAFTVEAAFTFTDVTDYRTFTLLDNTLGDTGWALRGYKRSGAGNPVTFVCNGEEYACSYGMGSVAAGSTHTFTVTARDGWMVVYMDGKIQRSYAIKPVVNVADLTVGAPLAADWTQRELPGVWLESLKVWGEDEKYYASGESATPATGYVGGKGWLCEVPVAPNANATNVLLVGDSISDGYTPCFKTVAGKKANVWHWTASFSTPGAEGVPTNKINEVCALTNLDAIVFNNGLHSLNWTESYASDAKVKESYAALVDCFRAAAPHARVHYLSTTPYTAVKDETGYVTALDPTNAVVLRLNTLARAVMDEKGVPYIDGYNLLVNQLSLARGDKYHWDGTAYPQLARLVSDTIGTTRPLGYWGGWNEYAAGDDVVIETNVVATAADADFAKIATFNSVTVNPGGELRVDISGDVTNTCSLVNQGCIRVVGPGAFHFVRGASLGKGALVLESGWTWCPQDYTTWTDCNLGTTTVGSNAVLVTACQTDGGAVNTVCNGLMGWGVVTNVTTVNNCQLRCNGTRAEPYRFYGSIRPSGIRYYSAGNQWLMNTNNTFNGVFEIHDGYGQYPKRVDKYSVTGIVKIGNSGKTGSGGTAGLVSRENGGTFLYLGAGETTSKPFTFYSGYGSPHFFDAGAHGGITFTGKWTNDTAKQLPQVEQVVITGSNTVPCVLANSFAGDQVTNRITYLSKRGTGTWRLNHHASRNNRGGIAVEEGVLQFETIAETNEVCSLGLATDLQSPYCGAYQAAKSVNYAFLLGTAATRGVMEYVGTADASCTTRVFAVRGEGEIRNGAADGVTLDLAGAANAPGADGTLVLGGTNTLGCFLRGTADASGGRLGIVKEGSGTWTLAGTQDFSGPLAVKAGTLEVEGCSTNRCTWFRLVLRGFGWLHGLGTSDGNIEFRGLKFYDAAGADLTPSSKMTYLGCTGESGKSVPNDWTHMQPGEYGWARSNGTYSRYVSGSTDRDISTLFALTGANSSICIYWVPIVALETPSTWAPIQLRLPADAGDAAAFDVLARDGKTNRRALTDWTMLGSVDGKTWHELARYDYDADTMPGAAQWFSDRTAYSNSESTLRPGKGYAISPIATEDAQALRNVTSVTVAPGATLKAVGHVTLPAVTFDCAAGAGTIDGFTFPSSGTLTILHAKSGSVVLPGSFVNCVGLANLSKWAFTVNGDRPRDKVVVVHGSQVKLVPTGSVYLLR